jgi:hypothetical protein
MTNPVRIYDLKTGILQREAARDGFCSANYGRSIDIIYNAAWGCTICGNTPSISFDSSEDEYYTISICVSCFNHVVSDTFPEELQHACRKIGSY